MSFTVTQSSVSKTAAERLRSFCCFISTAKPASSIVNPFSFAINFVKSNGKPKVSYNSNTVFPAIAFAFITTASTESVEFALSLALAKISSILFRPLSNVLKKASSSSFTTLLTKSNCCINSGKTLSNCFAITGNN